MKFKLFGAERFAQYLESVVKGKLTVDSPENHGTLYGKRWIIRLDQQQLGEYFTFGPKPGETDFGREYNGRIPRYKNEAIALANKYKSDSEKDAEDAVSLVYANRRFEPQLTHEGPGMLVSTPWQRQDGHDKIPFP